MEIERSKYWRNLLVCTISFKIRKTKFSSEIGAFFYPMFAKWARANTMSARVSENLLAILPKVPKWSKRSKWQRWSKCPEWPKWSKWPKWRCQLAFLKICCQYYRKCQNGQNGQNGKNGQNARNRKMARMVKMAKIAKLAETELTRCLKTVEIWNFFEKMDQFFAEKT